MAVNLVMMLFLPLETWLRLAAWLVIGLVIYFAYGHRRSILRQGLARPDAPAPFRAADSPLERVPD
jgi:APA family basic amino acid/polyamine antiporter